MDEEEEDVEAAAEVVEAAAVWAELVGTQVATVEGAPEGTPEGTPAVVQVCRVPEGAQTCFV